MRINGKADAQARIVKPTAEPASAAEEDDGPDGAVLEGRDEKRMPILCTVGGR
jgi:hypothetical protein